MNIAMIEADKPSGLKNAVKNLLYANIYYFCKSVSIQNKL